jgi:hypothetical protein
VHVLGQYNPTVNDERLSPTHLPKHIAQRRDVACEQVVAVPPQGIDREEIGAAWMPDATVIGHALIVPANAIRRNALRLLRPTRAEGSEAQQVAYGVLKSGKAFDPAMHGA